MEERPPNKHRNGSTRGKDHPTTLVDETGGSIKCTGRSCRSCTGGVVADCIAVCCCPCAVLSCFTLAFFKAPYLMGRRCLGLGKKKEKPKRCKSGEVNASFENKGVEIESLETIGNEFENDQEEEERVWLELYQLGHLGFGRVSFTGIQSQGKGN